MNKDLNINQIIIKFNELYPNEKDITGIIIKALENYKEDYDDEKIMDYNLQMYVANGRHWDYEKWGPGYDSNGKPVKIII